MIRNNVIDKYFWHLVRAIKQSNDRKLHFKILHIINEKLFNLSS